MHTQHKRAGSVLLPARCLWFDGIQLRGQMFNTKLNAPALLPVEATDIGAAWFAQAASAIAGGANASALSSCDVRSDHIRSYRSLSAKVDLGFVASSPYANPCQQDWRENRDYPRKSIPGSATTAPPAHSPSAAHRNRALGCE